MQERTCRVYMLFGKVIGVLDEPGLHFLPGKLGPAAFVINLLGNCFVLDMRVNRVAEKQKLPLLDTRGGQ